MLAMRMLGGPHTYTLYQIKMHCLPFFCKHQFFSETVQLPAVLDYDYQ